MNRKVLIIPNCTDLNRGDQALVLETSKVIKKSYGEETEVYMMTEGETSQCQKYGLKIFSTILKHPSRMSKSKKSNIKYGKIIKMQWGLIAIADYLYAKLLLNKITRKLIFPFLDKETKKSISLYEECDACFVKGGGFLHDYSGGMIGTYTMFYQLYHIKLALSMNKKVYIMPNSFGPFKSERTKKMVNKVLDKVEIVTARESISASGKTNDLDRDIKRYPDLAFFLDRKKEINWDDLQKKYNLNKNDKYVAITVRPYRFYEYNSPEEKYEEYKQTFVKMVKYLREKEYMPLFVVHTRATNDHENDELCIKEITNLIADKNSFKVIKDDNLDCYDLKQIYRCCEFIIGTRFHSVIFSIEQKVPAIAITYGGNKGDGIMKDMLLKEYAIKIGELSFQNLKSKFNKLENEKESVVRKLDTYLSDSKEKYQELIKEIKNRE